VAITIASYDFCALRVQANIERPEICRVHGILEAECCVPTRSAVLHSAASDAQAAS
jgi:hypothetical protein